MPIRQPQVTIQDNPAVTPRGSSPLVELPLPRLPYGPADSPLRRLGSRTLLTAGKSASFPMAALLGLLNPYTFKPTSILYHISVPRVSRGVSLEVPQGAPRDLCKDTANCPASAHSAYIGVYVFAPASTERRNPLQAIRSLQGHPTGGPSLRDGHSQLSHRIKRIGSARKENGK